MSMSIIPHLHYDSLSDLIATLFIICKVTVQSAYNIVIALPRGEIPLYP